MAICEGNLPVTSETPSHRVSNAEHLSMSHNDVFKVIQQHIRVHCVIISIIPRGPPAQIPVIP